MSLLDELKQEADHRRKEEEVLLRDSERKEKFYREHTLPRMIKVYNYLDELVKAIVYLKREIYASYKVDGVGDIDDLLQVDYKVATDSTHNMKRVAVSFRCFKNDTIEFDVKGEKAVEQQVSYLLSHKLDFEQKRKRTLNASTTESRFTMKCSIPVTIALEVNIEKSELYLKIYNFDGLGLNQRTIKTEDVDDKFLDNLGRYVLRQDETFLRQELSRDELARIRKNLVKEEKRRAKELGVKPREFHQLEEEKNEGLLQRVRGKLFK
ncbi:MAG: hypothetical protein D6B28_09560 [Gammaproteobacteria bacterium]|nr:MAG: hypothetical protein D6B28_09560 [Gammaproteobacteria bacterium]